MRAWVLSVAAMLAGCAPQLESSRPLFVAGHDSLKPGVWALIDKEPCPVPTMAQTLRWPSCALPVLVEAGGVTLTMLAPLHGDLALVDGTPHIIQIGFAEPRLPGTPGDWSPDHVKQRSWGYYSLEPDGPAPFVRGIVRTLRCPADGEAPISGVTLSHDEGTERSCVASTPDGVRGAAGRSVKLDPEYHAYWVADYP